MIKQVLKFEYLIEGKKGDFLLEYDTPVQVAKEMAFQFLKYLGQLEDEAKQKESEKLSVETSSTEVSKEDLPKE